MQEKVSSLFPKGFYDEKYISWERGYKWQAHLQFQAALNKETFARLLAKKKYPEIAQCATKIDAKANLLFSFQKMALRDAVKTQQGQNYFRWIV